MFGARRRIGTPRATATGKKKTQFQKHNEGHTIYTHSSLPPIIQEALIANPDSKPNAILNANRHGTCGFILNAQVFIWNIKSDNGPKTADVLILDLPTNDSFVSFTGDSSGIFSCSATGIIQFWPSFLKSSTYNFDLPLAPGATISSIHCTESFCWIGSTDGKISHLRLKRDGNSTLQLLRQVNKGKSVLGRMFSWGWGSQSVLGIHKIRVSKRNDEKHYILALNDDGVDVWISSETEDQLSQEVPIRASLEEQMNAPVILLDCQKYKKAIYVLFQTKNSQADNLYLVQIANVFSRTEQTRTKKSFPFEIPSTKRNENLIFARNSCRLAITPAGATVITTPSVIIATEVPVDKAPLIVSHIPIGLGMQNENLPLVITTREILIIDITRVIKTSLRPTVAPDTFTERFEAFVNENRIEEFAKTEDQKELATLVTKFSSNILDDRNTDREDSSLLLHQRLEEKNEKHRKFIEFLSLSKTFDYLPNAAKLNLLTHMEKMEAAIALHEAIHSLKSSSGIIRDTIDNCVAQRQTQSKSRAHEGYTREDIFFSEVTKIEQILECIPLDLYIRKETANAGIYLYESNLIFLAVLSAPWKKRKHFCQKLKIDGDCATGLWNFTRGLRNRVLTHNAKYVGPFITALVNSEARHSLDSLGEQLQELDEFLLDTYQFELEAGIMLSDEFRNEIKELFENAKETLILKGPFLLYNKDLAKDLAEKYLDFNTITRICDSEQFPRNIQQLNPYLQKYADTDFPAFVFKYFCDNGRYDELLSDHLQLVENGMSGDALSDFLVSHSKYSWLQSIRVGSWSSASSSLLQESYIEVDNINRRGILLGLSKLANLAADDDTDYTIDHARYLNDYQRIKDPSNQVPQDPNAFIEQNIQSADFVGAMELYAHTTLLREEAENSNVLFLIWAHCLAADDWFNISESWRTNQINDDVVEKLIKESFMVQLCQSGSSHGFWNSDLLKSVMKTYYDRINSELQSSEEQRKSLDRLLMITLRYCDETVQ